MSFILLKPKYEEKMGLGAGEPVQKIYNMEGENIEGIISAYSVPPLRILAYVLQKKEIRFQTQIDGNDPWEITKILFDSKHAEFVKIALKEIMEYRCSYELDHNFEEIIRQLPFEIAMKTSEYIMNYEKPYYRHNIDLVRSREKWALYNAMVGRNSCENPNDKKDNLIISKEEPTLRRHLIYKSSRGGYNIKTLGYNDSSLDHYSFLDSKKWD